MQPVGKVIMLNILKLESNGVAHVICQQVSRQRIFASDSARAKEDLCNT